jgi:hypothetical protein
MRARFAQRAQLHADTWYQVATATSLTGLPAAVPTAYQQVPVGKRIRITCNTSPFPVAPIFDLAGAEFAAQLLVHNGKLIDVSGNGLFEIVFEIESVETVSQESPDTASMGFPFMVVAAIIAVIVAILILVPKQAAMFVNYVAKGFGTGIAAFFQGLFGDNWPYIVGGAVVVAILLLKPKRSQQQYAAAPGPVIYNLPAGSQVSKPRKKKTS